MNARLDSLVPTELTGTEPTEEGLSKHRHTDLRV